MAGKSRHQHPDAIPPHEHPPTQVPRFSGVESLRRYFRVRTGSAAPYLQRGHSPEEQRSFLRRVLAATLHPRSSDRLLLYANARQARALALANTAASTVRALLDTYNTHSGVFNAAGVDMRRVAEIAAYHGRQAKAETGGEELREPLRMTRADTTILHNIVYRLNAAAENPTLSPHWAAHKAAETAVTEFRARVAATSRGMQFLSAAWVGDQVKAARKLAVEENAAMAAAVALETTAANVSATAPAAHVAANGDDDSKAPPPQLRSPRALRELLHTPAGKLPEFPVVVLAIPAAPSVADVTTPNAKAENTANAEAPPSAPPPPPPSDEDRELAAKYANLVAMQRRTRAHWDAACPFRRVAKIIGDLKDSVYAVFDADAKATGEAAANAAKASEGKHAGAAMEAAVWFAAQEHLRVALRAANRHATAASQRRDTPDNGDEAAVARTVHDTAADEADDDAAYLATDFPIALVGTPEAAAARFVLVQSVKVKQNGRQVGELDGVVVDRRRRCAALVCEVKRTAADLGYARAQRVRFAAALALAAKGPDTEVAPVPAATAAKGKGKGSGGGKRLANDNIVYLAASGPQATAYAAAVADGTLPAMDAALFAAQFMPQSVQRWLLLTTGGHPPHELPLPSKVGYVAVKELGMMLALGGWPPPPVASADDHNAVAEAATAALHAFDDHDVVRDGDVRGAVESLAGAWRKAAGADPEHLHGLPLLEHEVVEAAVPASAVGLRGTGIEEEGLVCPTVAWVDVDVAHVALH